MPPLTRREAYNHEQHENEYLAAQHGDKRRAIMTQYLNTDLDLVSTADLTALAADLEARGLDSLHVDRQEDSQWIAIFESSAGYDQPETTILMLLDVIESLDEPSRRAWWECTKREFNIGYDCGSEPWAFNQALSNQTLLRMANAGAGLRITLYPHQAIDIPGSSEAAGEVEPPIDRN